MAMELPPRVELLALAKVYALNILLIVGGLILLWLLL